MTGKDRTLPGTLYIVATPIGNLEDITLRALRILREVAVIACEDTRQTLKLLQKHEFKKELVSYFQPREGQKIPLILDILRKGKDVALVSDSGTPGISDPGFKLVREALKQEIKVVPIPGAAAVVAALCASGLPTHRFLFVGFPSPKKGPARRLLSSVGEEEGTLIFYLSPRKIEEFLGLVLDVLGDRIVVVAREMTKIHEEFMKGRTSEILARVKERPIRGEITVLIEGKIR